MGEASCPKATIVVPVYNSARSIQRCLDSLLAQSERSIQVVCVNDGSTDDSLDVLRQIAQADDRVLVIDQENVGVSCARNAGIDAAEGETLFFVDADDYIDAQTVERVLHAMEMVRSIQDLKDGRFFYLDYTEDYKQIGRASCRERV